MIPQTCRYKGRKFECGLSISCVLGGGKAMDLCSGGMIWSCCIDRDLHSDTDSTQGAVHNASQYKCTKFSNLLKLDSFFHQVWDTFSFIIIKCIFMSDRQLMETVDVSRFVSFSHGAQISSEPLLSNLSVQCTTAMTAMPSPLLACMVHHIKHNQINWRQYEEKWNEMKIRDFNEYTIVNTLNWL